MRVYRLSTKRNPKTGEIGAIVDTGRGYHEPLGAEQVAHDILEHPAKPHPDGVLDEYMALGGIIAGRVAVGHQSRGRIRPAGINDIVYDLSRLFEHRLRESRAVAPPCRSRLDDRFLMEDIEEAVERGADMALSEVDFFTEDPNSLSISGREQRAVVGWICRGYRLYVNRFNWPDQVAAVLFDEIVETVATWLKKYGDLEGVETTLHVDFTSFEVFIKEIPY